MAETKISYCRRCGAQFKARRNRRYCTDRCRWLAWSSQDDAAIVPCFYCGVPAETVDHVPPRAARSILVEHGIKRWEFLTVDACSECNSALGARSLFTVTERKQFINQWIKKRYGKYLLLPEWDDGEKDEMGYSLRQYIDAGIIVGEITRRRIKWSGE